MCRLFVHMEEYAEKSSYTMIYCSRTVKRHHFLVLVSNSPTPGRVFIRDRCEGGFHHVVTIDVGVGDPDMYVVKVPAHGTPTRWQVGDAYNLRSEAETMMHVQHCTQVPIPKVINYDDTLDNEIRAPYILMEFVQGKPAYDVWYQDGEEYPEAEELKENYGAEDEDGEEEHYSLLQDSLTYRPHQKRCNFLKSLAKTIAELQALQFDKIGQLSFDNVDEHGKPDVGHSWHWKRNIKPEDLDTEKAMYKRLAYSSSEAYWNNALNNSFPYTEDDEQMKGIRYILDAVFRCVPLCWSANNFKDDETFVLQHGDLNLQNIYVDEDGNVVGIIDWESCMAVPRCVGYASVPVFLKQDWESDFSLDEAPHQAWSLNYYRHVYAKAMIEATGGAHGDGKYTLKSALYSAAWASLYGGGSAYDLIEKIFHEIPGLGRVDVEEFETKMGKGWHHGELYLQKALKKVFAPELPGEEPEMYLLADLWKDSP